ncbi:MAG: L,D-transpeptidase [Nitrospiraceae bacterium]|nr:MAG: L,D-transpeptidase [Nitrospiraceae bacterium]
MLRNSKYIILSVILVLFLSLECLGYYLAGRSSINTEPSSGNVSGQKAGKAVSNGNSTTLKKKISALSPKGVYIVIDTARNRLYLKKGDVTLREAVISSGSGNMLTDPSGNRTWVFDTPRGEHSVRSKIENPDWIKPDWAFVEEGEKIPSNYGDRIESGMLGDYALSIGNGYLIHGTLYKRLLGRNVTHGCIRVGDEDLEYVFRNTPIGSKVIIF